MGVLSESEAATSALMHAARVSPREEERHATQAGGGVMLLFIGTHSVTTTLNVHSLSRSFVRAVVSDAKATMLVG